jgi:hypothetical protein
LAGGVFPGSISLDVFEDMGVRSKFRVVLFFIFSHGATAAGGVPLCRTQLMKKKRSRETGALRNFLPEERDDNMPFREIQREG